MNAFALILVALTVVVVAGWPGALVGLIVGIKRKHAWPCALAGFAGGCGGTILGALIWSVLSVVLPKKTVRGEFGSGEVPAHISEEFMVFLLWCFVLLGSCALGWFAAKSKLAKLNEGPPGALPTPGVASDAGAH